MINTDAVTAHLPARVQSLLAAFGALLGMVLFVIVCWGGIDGAAHAWTSREFEGEGAMRIPAWPARFAIVGGTALAALSYFLLMLRNLDAVRRGAGPVVQSATH